LYPDIPEIGIPGTFQGRPGGDLGLMYKRTSGMWTLISSLLIHLFSAIKTCRHQLTISLHYSFNG
jgi:hypothetical protein